MRTLADGKRASRGAPSLDELRARRSEIVAACSRLGASNIRVFGSVARGEQDQASDADLLIDFETGRSLFDLSALVLELEDLLGCPVDVALADSLKERSRGRILGEAVPL